MLIESELEKINETIKLLNDNMCEFCPLNKPCNSFVETNSDSICMYLLRLKNETEAEIREIKEEYKIKE